MTCDVIRTDFFSILGKNLFDISVMRVPSACKQLFFFIISTFYPVTTLDLKKEKKQFHWLQVLTDSEHYYWKTIWKVLYTGCPKKVADVHIEMAVNIWPRKSDLFWKTEILSYLAR